MAKDCIRSPRNHAGTVHLADAGACHRAADADKGSGTQKDVLKAFANGLYPAACAIVILTGPSAKKLAGISGVCYNSSMEKKVYTTDEWNHADKEELVGIILSLQENRLQRYPRNSHPA